MTSNVRTAATGGLVAGMVYGALFGAWFEHARIVEAKEKPAARVGYSRRWGVLSASDGDTLKAYPKSEEQRLRLLGVEAAESDEAGGVDATAFLDDLTSGKVVTMVAVAEKDDPFGRPLVHGHLDGRCAAVEFVRAGMAKVSRRYPDRLHLADLEAAEVAAKSAKVGVWR